MAGHDARIESVGFVDSGKCGAFRRHGWRRQAVGFLHTGYAANLLGSDEEPIEHAGFASNGKFALSGRRDGTLELWDLSLGNPGGAPIHVTALAEPDGTHGLAVDPTGRIAIMGCNHLLKLIDIQTGKVIYSREGLPDAWYVAVAPGGTSALIADQNCYVKIWKPTDPPSAELPVLCLMGGWVSLAYSPDGKWAAVADGVRVKVFSTADWREVHTIASGSTMVRNIAFSPDSQQVLSATSHGVAVRASALFGFHVPTPARFQSGW